MIPETGLLEISSAITLFQKRFGHVSLYVEALDPTVCFIGEYLDLDDDFVLGDLAGILAGWACG